MIVWRSMLPRKTNATLSSHIWRTNIGMRGRPDHPICRAFAERSQTTVATTIDAICQLGYVDIREVLKAAAGGAR